MGVRSGPWWCAYNHYSKPLAWTVARSKQACKTRLMRNICKSIQPEKWARLERRGYTIRKIRIVEVMEG